MPISYVNGHYSHHAEATVHIEDRGFQFADSIYEVIAVQNGVLVDGEEHFDRMERSLAEISVDAPMSRAALKLVIRELLRQNRLKFGALYLQITRGQAPRSFIYPVDILPTLVMAVMRLKPIDIAAISKGVDIITIPDIRWKRCDIKTVALLGGAMGKNQAADQGAFEAWMYDQDGNITEGTSSNAWIVTKQGQVITRALTGAVLGGITRQTILKLAKDEGLDVVERSFSVEEAKQAKEAFTSSTTAFIRPIVNIDQNPVGNGEPGEFCLKLLDLYAQHIQKTTR